MLVHFTDAAPRSYLIETLLADLNEIDIVPPAESRYPDALDGGDPARAYTLQAA